MIDRVFGIKARMSGLSINRYRPIIGRLLNANYQPTDNRLLAYRCISSVHVVSHFTATVSCHDNWQRK